MKYYNREKLVKIEVEKLRPTDEIYWQSEKRVWGLLWEKAGYYWRWHEAGCLNGYLAELPSNYVNIDGTIHRKPEVILTYEGGCIGYHTFDTDEEALAFKEGIISIGTWKG